MRKLKIGIVDFITKAPNGSLWARFMHANLVGIMPQVVACWCEELGHEVSLVLYTGFLYTGVEDLYEDVPRDIDTVFISVFTQSAIQAYALSCKYRSEGIITVLVGLHARCYPEDAEKYFDYVLGLTDKEICRDVLEDLSLYKERGVYMSASKQPASLPGVQERWKFISLALDKAPWIKVVPMMGSVGYPYTCSFCIDADQSYQTLGFDAIRDDLRFLLTKFKRPLVIRHDPNFGVRFDDYMDTLEDAVPPDSVDSIVESSPSPLSKPHLKRLRQSGFKAVLRGIESWNGMGNKSKTGSKQGLDKLQVVSEHVNMVLRYDPYIQTNFVLGLDCDEGPESFELTKKFLDMSPTAVPAFPLLTSFGKAAPDNLGYQQEERVLPFPFHFLSNNHAMNVKPKTSTWPEFYDRVIDLVEHSFSRSSIINRFRNTNTRIPRWMNLLHAVSTEGFGRMWFYRKIRRLLDEDKAFRDYFEGETSVLPEFYLNIVRKNLGKLWEWFPEGALYHDQNAYYKLEQSKKNRKPAPATPMKMENRLADAGLKVGQLKRAL
jgi:hypothetical protein